jgi:hypothetical protein
MHFTDGKNIPATQRDNDAKENQQTTDSLEKRIRIHAIIK